MTVFGRYQNHAVCRARAVNRSRRGTLQNLHVLDVIGVDVDHAVRRRCSLELTAYILAADSGSARIDRIEVRRGERVVSDRNTVDDEERLDVPVQRAKTSNLNARISTGISRRLRDLDVRRFPGERLDQIRFVCLLDQIRRDDVANVAESLNGTRCSRAGHNDLAELQRVCRKCDILRHRSGCQRDPNRLDTVSNPPRRERNRLTRDARSRNGDRISTVVTGYCSEPKLRDRHCDIGQGTPILCSDPTGNHRCLSDSRRRRQPKRERTQQKSESHTPLRSQVAGCLRIGLNIVKGDTLSAKPAFGAVRPG